MGRRSCPIPVKAFEGIDYQLLLGLGKSPVRSRLSRLLSSVGGVRGEVKRKVFGGQGWLLHFSIFGVDLQQLFQVKPYNLSVAVWVGLLALFGMATVPRRSEKQETDQAL